MDLFEIDENKCYLIKVPIFGNVKLRSYLYHHTDLDEFLKKAVQFCKDRSIPLLEIFTRYDLDKALSSNFKNYEVEKSYRGTYILDLKLGEDAIWRKISKACRRNIKKAIKNNVEIRILDNIEDFDAWWEVYVLTSDQRQFVKQRYELVREVFEAREISRLFVAIIDDKIVAGKLLLIHKTPVEWLGGSLPEFWKFRPNNLLQWEMIKWSQKKEYPFYDFGSARRENHGPSEFKRRFGGEYKESHKYSIILQPLKSKIIDKMIKWRYALSKQH